MHLYTHVIGVGHITYFFCFGYAAAVADVRLDAQYKTIDEIRQLQLTNSSGNTIPLTSIATVKTQESRANRYGRANGEDSISLSVIGCLGRRSSNLS